MAQRPGPGHFPSLIERHSLCLPSVQPGVPMHHGEEGFLQDLARRFPSAENNALEKLVQLKRELKKADTETFWKKLMEGMTEICYAQYGFVAKRVLADDHHSAVEMPPFGETGSCLLGVAFYYNDGDKQQAMHRDYNYLAWGSPCSYMKHDKVFLIPEQMSSFITHNPNALPFPAEGYIGVPLFAGGKCFAHFGMMWTQEGLDRRDTTWSYTELLLHSLEDMIVERLMNGQGFAKPRARNPTKTRTTHVIPREAVTPGTQSLKPYAKNLSHELRTPMQGVVGMLDVMHASVQEQIEGLPDADVRQIFQSLRDNIETIQDSAKRAVEAADNVVHAYDLNMQIPDTPSNDHESPATGSTGYFDYKPARLIEGSDIHVNAYKRRRSSPTPWHFGNATKMRQLAIADHLDVSPKNNTHKIPPSMPTPQTSSSDVRIPTIFTPTLDYVTSGDLNTPSTKLSSVDGDAFPTPGLKHCNIRGLIPTVIHDSLRVGGRPDSAIGEATDSGETIIVRSRSSNGHISQKNIEWSVAQDVPETLLADERDLTKLVSAVFLNAVKFTEEGDITLRARLSKSQKYLVISCKDSGDGIPEDFQPELFKPFSREDDSLTRSKEGLGLGLLVAKGLARRLGGDIVLLGSEVSGPNKGSEFEIKIPFEPGENSRSRSGTPQSRTPEGTKSVSQSASATLTVPETSPRLSKSPKPSRIHLPAIEERSVLSPRTPAAASTFKKDLIDRSLAQKYPLTFLVAEDNKINRKLLVNMLGKLGYKDIYEAFDGKEAVRIMRDMYSMGSECGKAKENRPRRPIDVILMDLWMPEMDGYQATERILEMFHHPPGSDVADYSHLTPPIVLAVSADVTDEAIDRATKTGMEGFMTKPYKLADLQKLIVEFCVRSEGVTAAV